MNDGVVIMLIGMGVVFLFLMILMLFIRIVASSPKSGYGSEVSSSRGGAENIHVERGRSVSSVEQGQKEQEELAMVAAVAVALELAQRPGTGPGTYSQRHPVSMWNQSGKLAMCSGPRFISQVLASRRGQK